MVLKSIFDPFLKPDRVTIETDDFDIIEIDATTSENHEYRTELTKHEVEEGIDITDNAINLPIVLDISGVITDTPGLIGSNRILNSVSEKPSQNAFDFFTEIREKKILCYIHTSVNDYDKYIMIDFNYRKSRDESGGLFFDLSFEEVRFAEAKEGAVDDLSGEDKTAASKKKNQGTKKTTEATDAQNEKGASHAKQLSR